MKLPLFFFLNNLPQHAELSVFRCRHVGRWIVSLSMAAKMPSMLHNQISVSGLLVKYV